MIRRPHAHISHRISRPETARRHCHTCHHQTHAALRSVLLDQAESFQGQFDVFLGLKPVEGDEGGFIPTSGSPFSFELSRLRLNTATVDLRQDHLYILIPLDLGRVQPDVLFHLDARVDDTRLLLQGWERSVVHPRGKGRVCQHDIRFT